MSTPARRPVARWALVSSAAAPVLLIGGWQLGAARQPGGFDAVRDTISALAAEGATDRWIMTAGLAGLGICHVVTALGLRPAAVPGRVVLAIGGAATFTVAVFPTPEVGSSTVHVVAAGIGFGTLAIWPALARYPGRMLSIGAAVVLLGLLGWFMAEYFGGGPRVGLSERALAGAQALWPLAAVLLTMRLGRS